MVQSRTDDELRVVRQIKRVTHTRRNDGSRAAFDSLLECEHTFRNVFVPPGKRFEHKNEVSADSVNRAPTM